MYYRELRDRLPGILRHVQDLNIRVSLSDRFLEQLRRLVSENPDFVPSAPIEGEQCMGCMARPPDVKITNNSIDPSMGQCFCRPMWCLECLGKVEKVACFSHMQRLICHVLWSSGLSMAKMSMRRING
eukprot:TRINITY_DN12007_c6_g1_i1.p3 TRINITY_DN12007_c6_g1~~TRINITY_DN12007_c6_g1_i1.p3  ORF type:complete len:128 (+),score=6.13 TRINITY_DN12007_c6_g1_i1:805-1188(+)